ncbi:FliM/FliN family flagellar motor switch protein [Aliiroseovarius lamellibrachiae]|uniref:FliM/FliN family flagellar motor switch protein n=1 Tax=Aliiroseovarius lamellibrachiae TaxID=1924933 RepID=UPI001BE0F373|nr:FliM/FliN family flagellar motor switch protein [Aliiroseovarius lamellibrachiae]MBT2130080.1 FliM/FliN family flagellar motor switch protein [Aliiroseovarius lamellibrachiae]
MSEPNRSNVKRRLAGEGRPPPEIGRVTPELALRLAVARAGDDCMEMEVIATSVEMSRSVLTPLVEGIEEHSLLALLQGECGRLGLALFNPQLMAALIEKQTTGRVVPSPAAPRAPTRTDAIMCVDFCNAILDRFHAETLEASLPVAPALAGFQYAMALEDPRAIQMALEDIPYRVFNVTIDLERKSKEGQMTLVMPYDLPRAKPATGACDAGDQEGVMAEIAMDTQTDMNAVLHRVEMTLADVTALTVGAQISVPRDAVVRVMLEDIFGEKISLGRLGATAGHRAVCVNLTADPNAETDFAGSGAAMMEPMTASAAVAMPETSNMMANATDLGGGELAAAPLSAAPEMMDLPDLAELPDLPPMGGVDAPDLPPLEGLGDLSNLPDLSDLSLTD